MNNSIEIFGITFPSIWLFILVLSYCCVYIVFNVIPAFGCLYKIIKEKTGLLYAQLYFLLCLVPFFGTIFAALFYDFGEKSKNAIIILTYVIVICFIGCIISNL